MAHTQQSILKLLGKEAQISGGVITVYRGGKHINVNKFVDGVFVITPEGQAVLDNPVIHTDDGVEVIQSDENAAKDKAAKTGAKTKSGKAEVEKEITIDDLELGLGE